MTYQLIHNDILKWAASYTGPKFHGLFCDPPYHLTITKRFGKPGSAPAKHGKDGAFSRASRGFMGQAWDGGEIAFDPETWAAMGEHSHDGAFGMAFASSRGWHRLAVAIEDAGFIIHPSIFGWCFLSGFPKATQISSQVDDQWAKENYGGWCDCDDCQESE
jgi:site-specific DNA-methyltransferase (adenine-specific)